MRVRRIDHTVLPGAKASFVSPPPPPSYADPEPVRDTFGNALRVIARYADTRTTTRLSRSIDNSSGIRQSTWRSRSVTLVCLRVRCWNANLAQRGRIGFHRQHTTSISRTSAIGFSSAKSSPTLELRPDPPDKNPLLTMHRLPRSVSDSSHHAPFSLMQTLHFLSHDRIERIHPHRVSEQSIGRIYVVTIASRLSGTVSPRGES